MTNRSQRADLLEIAGPMLDEGDPLLRKALIKYPGILMYQNDLLQLNLPTTSRNAMLTNCV
jgi:hypothetical protein